nr:MAG TPA: hypothetical protein [Caudoviricetes sp.]
MLYSVHCIQYDILCIVYYVLCIQYIVNMLTTINMITYD